MFNKIFIFFVLIACFIVSESSAQDPLDDRLIYSSATYCLRDPDACEVFAQKVYSDQLIETNSPRTKFLDPYEITDMLKIEKGMTILDIGAGKGYFTIPFAKKLNGTGKVYASDIDHINIKDIRERAEKRNLSNIEAVIVKKDGIDPFYTKHSFDLIFASYLYYYLRDPEQYFGALRPSLKKDGRICIIQPFNNPDLGLYVDLDSEEVFRRIFHIFLHEGTDFPIFKRLNKKLQDYILNWNENKSNKIPLEIREEILKEFNNMLSDRTLFYSVLDYLDPKKAVLEMEVILEKYPNEGYLIMWLANALNDSRVFDSAKTLTDLDRKQLKKLNNVLIRKQLNFSPNILPGQTNPDRNILAQEDAIISTMESAGYKLLEEHMFKPAFLLIFGVAEETKS